MRLQQLHANGHLTLPTLLLSHTPAAHTGVPLRCICSFFLCTDTLGGQNKSRRGKGMTRDCKYHPSATGFPQLLRASSEGAGCCMQLSSSPSQQPCRGHRKPRPGLREGTRGSPFPKVI